MQTKALTMNSGHVCPRCRHEMSEVEILADVCTKCEKNLEQWSNKK